MNERFRIYAAVALTGLLVVVGGFLFLGRSSASSASSVHQIKPLHPHAKAKVALAPPKVRMTKAKAKTTPARRPAVIAGVSRIVVVADFIFTATAVVVQPITGVLLAWIVGYSLLDGWIVLSIGLYLLTGAFWLPVVWMQMRMRDLAAQAVREFTPLPGEYYRLFRLWFAFGFPAFAAVLAIFWLMIARPSLG